MKALLRRGADPDCGFAFGPMGVFAHANPARLDPQFSTHPLLRHYLARTLVLWVKLIPPSWPQVAHAAANGHADAVEALLEAGAKPQGVDPWARMAVMGCGQRSGKKNLSRMNSGAEAVPPKPEGEAGAGASASAPVGEGDGAASSSSTMRVKLVRSVLKQVASWDMPAGQARAAWTGPDEDHVEECGDERGADDDTVITPTAQHQRIHTGAGAV